MSLTGSVRMIISGIGNTIDANIAIAGTGAIVIDESIADLVTDGLIDCSFVLARLTAFYMCADQALEIATNSAGAPQETITLAANKPFVYVPGSGLPSPFAGNVTGLYVTNASGAAASLQIRALLDVTV